MQKRLVFKSKFFRFKHASNLYPLNYFPPCNYISFWPKADYETISIKCLLNALTLMKISHDYRQLFLASAYTYFHAHKVFAILC